MTDDSQGGFVHISEVIDKLFNQMDAVQQNRRVAIGVPIGFGDVDALTGGLHGGDLVAMGARPGIGKTSLALGMAYRSALHDNKSVGIFSLNESVEHIVQRLLLMETGINSHRLRPGQIEDHEWDRTSRAFGRLSDASIFIQDNPDLTVGKIRFLAKEHGLDLIIIDGLQELNQARREHRTEAFSRISRELKWLARDLRIPIVILTQISEAVEHRSDHRPMLSDLRELGSLEADADIVLFIYREDKYDENSDKKGIAEIIVAKHRNGPVGSVNLRFFDHTARFADKDLFGEMND